jgi:hypothetical protein
VWRHERKRPETPKVKMAWGRLLLGYGVMGRKASKKNPLLTLVRVRRGGKLLFNQQKQVKKH